MLRLQKSETVLNSNHPCLSCVCFVCVLCVDCVLFLEPVLCTQKPCVYQHTAAVCALCVSCVCLVCVFCVVHQWAEIFMRLLCDLCVGCVWIVCESCVVCVCSKRNIIHELNEATVWFVCQIARLLLCGLCVNRVWFVCESCVVSV